mmetsp:Transcript_119744/g.382217  ORF Transcript_119744/g.382217 Transcript_119744/m.382217 type:complete len:387 (+) Transcript_119744:631-1791(+)
MVFRITLTVSTGATAAKKWYSASSSTSGAKLPTLSAAQGFRERRLSSRRPRASNKPHLQRASLSVPQRHTGMPESLLSTTSGLVGLQSTRRPDWSKLSPREANTESNKGKTCSSSLRNSTTSPATPLIATTIEPSQTRPSSPTSRLCRPSSPRSLMDAMRNPRWVSSHAKPRMSLGVSWTSVSCITSARTSSPCSGPRGGRPAPEPAADSSLRSSPPSSASSEDVSGNPAETEDRAVGEDAMSDEFASTVASRFSASCSSGVSAANSCSWSTTRRRSFRPRTLRNLFLDSPLARASSNRRRSGTCLYTPSTARVFQRRDASPCSHASRATRNKDLPMHGKMSSAGGSQGKESRTREASASCAAASPSTKHTNWCGCSNSGSASPFS